MAFTVPVMQQQSFILSNGTYQIVEQNSASWQISL